MPDRRRLIDAVAKTAAAWRDPDHPPRRDAVEKTLEVSDAFTEEAVAFAVNQQMALLTEDALRHWAPDSSAPRPRDVGVLNAANVPLVELQDFLAVLLTGHRYFGSLSSRSPYLMQGFARELAEVTTVLPVTFVDASELFDVADAVIATGSDETAAWVQEQCDGHGIAPRDRLVRGNRFSVAVLDGHESADELERLAEDAMLHEGFGCRNVAVVWAPESSSPDALLEAFARFRGVFPAHPATPGRLSMQKAFLEAVNVPHGYGEGLEFLVSKGDPEPLTPGHVRWSEYGHLDEVLDWLARSRDSIQIVVARQALHGSLDAGISLVVPGEAQRPPLDWCPDGSDTMTFLTELE